MKKSIKMSKISGIFGKNLDYILFRTNYFLYSVCLDEIGELWYNGMEKQYRKKTRRSIVKIRHAYGCAYEDFENSIKQLVEQGILLKYDSGRSTLDTRSDI